MLIGIVDVETTGLDPEKDDLIEIAVAEFDTKLGFVDVWSGLVTHGKATTGAFEIHGITHDLIGMYGNQIDPIGECMDCLVAHNAEFDRQWVHLSHETPWACTMDMEWPRKSPNKSLTALALAHGVGVVSAHRAVSDVLTLVHVFERAKELGADLDAMIQHALRPKALFQALVSFNDKDLAKAAGFHWEPETKRWLNRAFVADSGAFAFEVKEVSA